MEHKMERSLNQKNLLSSADIDTQKLTNADIAEMVIEKALRDFRMKQLKKEIDECLLTRNKPQFMRLTNELAGLTNKNV